MTNALYRSLIQYTSYKMWHLNQTGGGSDLLPRLKLIKNPECIDASFSAKAAIAIISRGLTPYKDAI